jgi:hypothetical protein
VIADPAEIVGTRREALRRGTVIQGLMRAVAGIAVEIGGNLLVRNLF